MPLDAEPGPAQGDGVGEFRVEAALVGRLIRPRIRREGDGIDLRAAADLDAEVAVLRFGLEAARPFRPQRGVAADLVGLGRLLRLGRLVCCGRLLRLGRRGRRQRLGSRSILEPVDPGREGLDLASIRLDRLAHLRERPEPGRHAGDRERRLILRWSGAGDRLGRRRRDRGDEHRHACHGAGYGPRHRPRGPRESRAFLSQSAEPAKPWGCERSSQTSSTL
jgi:hypothetical protein